MDSVMRLSKEQLNDGYSYEAHDRYLAYQARFDQKIRDRKIYDAFGQIVGAVAIVSFIVVFVLGPVLGVI